MPNSLLYEQRPVDQTQSSSSSLRKMRLWCGAVLLVAVGAVTAQWVNPQDKSNCLAPNGFCTSITQCPFVPEQFRRQLSACETKDKVCCTRLLSPPLCSKRVNRVKLASRVSKAVPSKLGDWPWMAALGYMEQVKGAEFKWYCGGSLINQLFVLTAAHCRPALGQKVVQYLVRLGDLDLTTTSDAKHVERKEAKFIPHKDYKRSTKLHDIALIKLDQPVAFNDNIQPICLPVSDSLRSKKYDGLRAQVAGWGTTEETQFEDIPSPILLETEVIVRNANDCKARQEAKSSRIKISPVTQLCTISAEGEDTCKGDSGGPLMVQVGGVYYAVGVVSFGDYCGVQDNNGVYTKVTEYIDWIRDNVKDNI